MAQYVVPPVSDRKGTLATGEGEGGVGEVPRASRSGVWPYPPSMLCTTTRRRKRVCLWGVRIQPEKDRDAYETSSDVGHGTLDVHSGPVVQHAADRKGAVDLTEVRLARVVWDC